jgi:hypothetical protein
VDEFADLLLVPFKQKEAIKDAHHGATVEIVASRGSTCRGAVAMKALRVPPALGGDWAYRQPNVDANRQRQCQKSLHHQLCFQMRQRHCQTVDVFAGGNNWS